MLFTFHRYIIFCFLTLILSALISSSVSVAEQDASPNPPPTPPKTSEKPHGKPDKNQQDTKSTQPPTSPLVYTKQPNENGSQAGDKSSTDWWIVVFTGALVVIGGTQAWIYYRQARYMRQGLMLTKQAADAAEKSANIAEKSMTLLERPWIDISVEEPFKPSETIGQTIICKVANTGRTPAIIKRKGFVVHWSVEIPKYPIDRKDLSEIPTEHILHAGRHVNMALPIKAFSQKDMEEIFNGKQILAVFGSVLYDDIFGVRHITRFCRILLRNDGLGRFIFPTRIRPEYNDSD